MKHLSVSVEDHTLKALTCAATSLRMSVSDLCNCFFDERLKSQWLPRRRKNRLRVALCKVRSAEESVSVSRHYQGMEKLLKKQTQELSNCLHVMENPGHFTLFEAMQVWNAYEEKWRRPVEGAWRAALTRDKIYKQWQSLWFARLDPIMSLDLVIQSTTAPSLKRAKLRHQRALVRELGVFEDRLRFWEQPPQLYRSLLRVVQPWSKALNLLPDSELGRLSPQAQQSAVEKGRTVCSTGTQKWAGDPVAGETIWSYSVGEWFDERLQRWRGGYGVEGIATGEHIGAHRVEKGLH